MILDGAAGRSVTERSETITATRNCRSNERIRMLKQLLSSGARGQLNRRDPEERSSAKLVLSVDQMDELAPLPDQRHISFASATERTRDLIFFLSSEVSSEGFPNILRTCRSASIQWQSICSS